MGKKKRNKLIREIAAGLPKMQKSVFEKELVNGSDILPPGVLIGNVGGKEILAGKTYVMDKVVKQDVNHYRRMKSHVNKMGLDGAKAYIIGVKAMQFKQDKK